MSMNGIDYTKALSKEREYFQDANRKTKEAAEKRIEDTNNRSDHVIAKQRENFIEDKAELETNYQKSLDHLKDKTQASLENNSLKFHNDMIKERESFTQESMKKSKDFDQRLDDIKSSYGKAFASEKDRNEDLTNTIKNKYHENVTNIKEDTEKKLQTYQDRISSSGSGVKEQYLRERQQLVRAQEDRLSESYKDAAVKRAELTGQLNGEMKKSKDVHNSELDHQKNYAKDRLATMQNQFQDRYETLSTDYSQRNEDLTKSEQLNAVKTNREHQSQIVEMRKDYNSDLRAIELQKRREHNGSGEFSEVSMKQQGLKDKVIQDNKIKRLNNEIVEAQRAYQGRASREQDSFNTTLKTNSVEATALMDRKLNDANANKIVTISREREKAEHQIQNRKHQNNLDKTAYEAQLMNERNSATDRLSKLKENFNSSMKTLEEKHKSSLEDVTKTTNEDKKLFAQKMQETRSNEVFEMKREFAKMMDSTVQDYEQRLGTYQRDNEYLKMSMNQKVHNIIDQTEKQLESQRTLFEDRRAADVKGQQLLMDHRESQLKKDFSDMNISYQKKIDKMQLESETKLKLITNDYETKLKELTAISNKNIAAKDSAHKIELDRVRSAYEAEKVRVVSAYEDQIEAIKAGHKDQMDQMSNYKRLS